VGYSLTAFSHMGGLTMLTTDYAKLDADLRKLLSLTVAPIGIAFLASEDTAIPGFGP